MKNLRMFSMLCLGICASFFHGEAGNPQIALLNPSFERAQTNRLLLPNWDVISDDALVPNPFDFHDCTPIHGESALILISAPDRTCATIQQTLEQPLEAGNAYAFAIDCCALNIFDGNDSGKLEVWAVDTESQQTELLSVTPFITTKRWMTYPFILKPRFTYDAIRFSISGGILSTGPNATLPWHGAAIAIDHASHLMPIPKDINTVDLTALKYEKD